MSLETLLTDQRSAIISKWRNLIIGSYPTDTQRFLKKEKNQFANPVGKTLVEDVEILYDALTTGKHTDKISASLDNIIRIRAVQNFKPSQAVGFVLQLKKIVRDELEKNSQDSAALQDEIAALEERIENTALLAFDIYNQCCRKLYELRVNETKRQVGRLLKKANITIDIPGLEPDQ
jgi:hypothetical protein